jgi:hypothetical protein
MLLDRTVALVSHSGEATRIEVVSTLNLADQGSRWISTSVFGNVYSFLSENILWFGSVQGTDINISGARVSSLHHARRFSFRATLALTTHNSRYRQSSDPTWPSSSGSASTLKPVTTSLSYTPTPAHPVQWCVKHSLSFFTNAEKREGKTPSDLLPVVWSIDVMVMVVVAIFAELCGV